jgi:hypothetical protein
MFIFLFRIVRLAFLAKTPALFARLNPLGHAFNYGELPITDVVV